MRIYPNKSLILLKRQTVEGAAHSMPVVLSMTDFTKCNTSGTTFPSTSQVWGTSLFYVKYILWAMALQELSLRSLRFRIIGG